MWNRTTPSKVCLLLINQVVAEKLQGKLELGDPTLLAMESSLVQKSALNGEEYCGKVTCKDDAEIGLIDVGICPEDEHEDMKNIKLSCQLKSTLPEWCKNQTKKIVSVSREFAESLKNTITTSKEQSNSTPVCDELFNRVGLQYMVRSDDIDETL